MLHRYLPHVCEHNMMNPERKARLNAPFCSYSAWKKGRTHSIAAHIDYSSIHSPQNIFIIMFHYWFSTSTSDTKLYKLNIRLRNGCSTQLQHSTTYHCLMAQHLSNAQVPGQDTSPYPFIILSYVVEASLLFFIYDTEEKKMGIRKVKYLRLSV